MNPNLEAFLATIRFSELGADLLKKSGTEKGYNVLVGGVLFNSYADHPRQKVWLPSLQISSTAAGGYQILSRYFDVYKKQLKLPDFSPASQDAIAIQMIKECKAFDDIKWGRFDTAINKCRSRWASFPGAGYNQHENKIESLRGYFLQHGGTLIAG